MNEDYIATTRNIRVGVRTFYLADRSEPAESRYCRRAKYWLGATPNTLWNMAVKELGLS